jgi:predicted ATPase
VQTTSFVGREKEIEESLRRLEKSRLLTLMGTGGTGKTRLALEIGARVINEFRDGVWLAELAPITDPDRVLATVASAVGAREEPERPLRDTLVNFLKGKTVLLILDNCEHLLKAVSGLAADLLRSCPNLKIIAASRHSLGIAGEMTFPVPPLGMFDVRLHKLTGPDIAAQLSQYEAVRLFIERAVSVRPDFVVTNANAPALAEICSRLDGIPLAIELAAVRVRVLDLNQIAERLGDRFRLLRSNDRGGHLPHQQTLQTLIDWSFDLLSEPERILFRRLGVFVGGRTIEALEAVCAGDGIEDFEILDLIEQLVDKSLVAVEREGGRTPRYTILESVWQYSRDKLAESGEENMLRDRHLDYYLKFAEKAAPHLEGPEQKAWLDRCQAERFNFRAAFEWAVLSQKPESGFRIFAATYRVIEIRGSLAEAREVVADLLGLPHADVAPACLARFFVAAGRIAWAADRYDDCRQFHEKAQALFTQLGDEDGVALCEMLKGFLDRGDGGLDEAEAHFRKGLEIVERIRGSAYVRAGCLSGIGSIALDRGDPETARKLKEESLRVYEQIGDRWIIGLILWGISDVCIAQADYDRARSALAEWADITRDLGNSWMLPHILEGEASLAVAGRNPERAAKIFGAAEAARERFATEFTPAENARHDATLEGLKKLLPEKDLQAAWEEGRRASPWELIKEG